MATKTELSHDGEFILNEWDRNASRIEALLNTGENLEAGSVVGEVTASPGQYEIHDPDAVDGTETVAGVLVNSVDATLADTPCVLLVRGPVTVNGNELHFEGTMTGGEITNAKAALNALGIIVVE